jgi:hypothetical protein
LGWVWHGLRGYKGRLALVYLSFVMDSWRFRR